MTAEHRLPLVAFLALSALCLLVAAAGLRGAATPLPGVAGGAATLLADGAPLHVGGEVLVGRTSAAVPVGNDDPVVPTSVALPAAAPAGDTAAAPAPVARDRPVLHRPHHRAHHRSGHQTRHRARHATQDRATVRRPAPRQRAVTPAPVQPGKGLSHAAHQSQARAHRAWSPPARAMTRAGHHGGPRARARAHRAQHPGRQHGWGHRRH